jgi:hypothetical protein
MSPIMFSSPDVYPLIFGDKSTDLREVKIHHMAE